MKLVKLGLASVLAVSLSSSAGYAGVDVQVAFMAGFGSPKLTKFGKAHKKNFDAQFAKYDEEHEKVKAKHADHLDVVDGANTTLQREKAKNNKAGIEKAQKDLDDLKKSEAHKKYNGDLKKHLDEFHKNIGEKFENHDELEAYKNGLNGENEEKELSGWGWGFGADVSVKFNVADSIDVGPYIGYKFFSGSYEVADKNEKSKDESKSDKKDTKKEEYSLVQNALSFGGFVAYNINNDMSIKAYAGICPVWRSLERNDHTKNIGDSMKWGMSTGVQFSYKFTDSVGAFVGAGGVIVFSGEAKDSSEDSKSNDNDNNKDNKDKKVSKVQDHHLASSYFELSLGLLINAHKA